MKINVKLFLLTFAIVTFVSVSSAFIYNLLTHQLLKNQQSKSLVNSANDFIFEFQKVVQKIDEDFQNISPSVTSLNKTQIDFLFQINQDSSIIKSSILMKEELNIYTDVKNLSDFLKFNTNIIVRNSTKDNHQYYYGKWIDINIINELSEKIRAEIAFVEGDVVTRFTNNQANLYYLPYLSRVSRELKQKNNFELVSETINDADFSATHYSPKSSIALNNEMDFIIFNISKEAAVFKSTLNLVTLIIVVCGIFLTVIFLLLFTIKFRKQLEFISLGVKDIAEGKTENHVKIISNDEIGNLGKAFNNMLSEIEKRDQIEKEYSEFISLINQKPTLEEIGDATLNKIISFANVDAGALYLYESNKLNSLSAYGFVNDKNEQFAESTFYKNAREKKELVEIHFQENNPTIKTGITVLKINYLYILPIFYNNKIIAIVELASVNKPNISIKNYLNRIKDQLAIGLANGKALTELKNLVEELQNLNHAYQKQNQEITEKNDELLLLHTKLKNGTKELEYQTKKAIESEKVKSQFLANMSHELRTPQNSILGLTELILKDGTTSQKTKERLNVVLRNGKKLLTLIENILEYSKLECGNSEIKNSKIMLTELLNEVTAFIKPLFLEREIEFIVNKPDQTLYELNIDIKKVEQIIYNLIGNAAKFTQKGYVKLSVKVINNDLEIIVEDTGPGVSEEDKNIIFDEFRQADANLNRKYSGTGLGLAICKRYSELLNGKIVLESETGVGSVFTVSLPNVVTTLLINTEPIISEETEDSKLSALIISDGIESIRLISDYLISNKIKVNVKNSSQINELDYHLLNPDIIIIDILLKNISGWNLLSNIKSDQNYNEIPVIVVNMDEDANCGLGLNVYKYNSTQINKTNIYKSIELIEFEQSIKFRKLLFIMSDEKYDKLEDELITDEIKFYHTNGKLDSLRYIKNSEPDIIFVDLADPNISSIKLLTEINDDLYTKSIPVIAFVKSIDTKDQKLLDNALIETTLVYQYHPLDVLKIIKDRIDLYDSTVIANENQLNLIEPAINDIVIKNNKTITNKIKILIVDDDDDARFTIGEIVESLGYETSFAVNGYQCLDRLHTEVPDIVLLDIMMPKMDGFQTIKKIRENKNFKDINVYALTAYAMLSDKEIIEKNGFNGLFTKPVNTIQIERKLNQIFNSVT